MTKKLILSLAFGASLALSAAQAQDFPLAKPKQMIPTPPEGERWVLNDTFSDEFNEPTLDSEKWYNYHPTWIGRQPGLFVKENVSMEDGKLVLKGGVMAEPHKVTTRAGEQLVYDISCAAVVSKAETAHYGYYETRAKANKTSLSTTFWLSRGGNNHNAAGNQPEWLVPGKYGQELDICETIGRGGTTEEGWTKMSNNFHKGMNANVHCWYTPEGGKRGDVAIKKIPQLQPKNGVGLSEDYHIYGGWWKNENTAEFYLDNISSGEKKFLDRQGRPFNLNQPMGLNLVVETYAWIPRPTDADLLDPEKNATYYDWVRHYVLKPINQADKNPAPAQKEVFEDYVLLDGEATMDGKKIALDLIYSAPLDRSLIIEILDSNNKKVGSSKFNAYAGFANGKYTLSAKTKAGEKYRAVVYLVEKGAKATQNYLAGDSKEYNL